MDVSVPKAGPPLDDLFIELQKGRVYECSVRDPIWIVDGIQDGDTIYIDPRPSILDTLIHELLHRARPKWSETAVRKHTAYLMNAMTDEQIRRRWWRAYQRTKKRHRPIEANL